MYNPNIFFPAKQAGTACIYNLLDVMSSLFLGEIFKSKVKFETVCKNSAPL